MTTTPDPKTVREIAREFLLDPYMSNSDFKASIRDHIGTDASDETFSAWYDAIRADVRKGSVKKVASWPDEQDADVRAVAEACSDFGNDEGPRGIRQLYARFADRIAAQDNEATS